MACYSSPDEEFSVSVYANDEDESADQERGNWAVDLLREMLENDEFADFELQSKEGSIVKANKQVLARASPLIRLALQTEKTRLFHTERWGEAAIRQVLAYLYLGRADLSHGIAVDVAQMARELGLERLQIQTLAFIKFHLEKFILKETVSTDVVRIYMPQFMAEIGSQGDFINNNQAIFQRTLAKLSIAKVEVENQISISTRTRLLINSQGNRNLKWPIYHYDPQSSTLSCSRVETPELTFQSGDFVTVTVNDDEIFLLATCSKKETHFFRAKLVAEGGVRQINCINWTKHPKIVQKLLYYPVIFDGMIYAICYDDAGSRCCYRLCFNDLSADWQSFNLGQVTYTGCLPFRVMPLVGRGRVVVCPDARQEGDDLNFQIFALDKMTTCPNLIAKAKFKMSKPLAPQCSLVISETLYLFTDSNQLFEFNGLTMEMNQFMMVEGPKPHFWPPLTSCKVNQDVAVVLEQINDADINSLDFAWSFDGQTRTWLRLTDDQLKRHFE